MKKTHINIHHTAIFAKDDKTEQFDTVNESHRKRWSGKTKSSLGFYGGYHYIVERNGAVQQFREEFETGAHNDKQMMNYRAIGVCFAGNMSQQYLTDAQIKAGVELIKDIQSRLGISDENIQPHRKYKATQCCGNLLPDPVWPYLQQKYSEIEIDQPASKWALEAQKNLTELGITSGARPHDLLTREECWVMIDRAMKYLQDSK